MDILVSYKASILSYLLDIGSNAAQTTIQTLLE